LLGECKGFPSPVASFEEATSGEYTILSKFNGHLFAASQTHTPFDVVAWHGLYYPYKYDLGRFSTIGSISFDHPDPSIFTVLTAPTDHVGTAVADFVIFPPRWLVGEDTFRPPWYHRNTMSEFMGLIGGEYDAKTGGASNLLEQVCTISCQLMAPMLAHIKKPQRELKPAKVGEGSMAFMFESCLMVGVTEWGLKTCKKVQEDYNEESWTPLKTHFKIPEGVRRVSNLVVDANGHAGIDIGKGASGEINQEALPHYT
jgi:homogentisate 1,2-dioxygenase